MTQLLGNSDTTLLDHTSGFELFQDDMAAALHTATASGTVEEIHFYLRADSSDTAVSVDLGIYADASGTPGALLGRASVAVGSVTGPLWVVATGLSVPVLGGHTYWLAVMPTGGSGVVFYDVASPSAAGSSMAFDNADIHTQLPDPFTATPFLEADGPAGLYATGTLSAGPGPITGLDWHVTGLWYPGATTVEYYGRIADPQDGEVVIPLNDSRTAKVTVSTDDDIASAVVGHAYARMLKAYYNGTLVFWGVIKMPQVNMDEGTVTFNAVCPSIRVIRQYLRRGDLAGALNAAGGDRANVSVDQIGLHLLLDAARNTAGQTARGCADIGIEVGTNDFGADPTSLMGVARGDQDWNTMLNLSQSLGPDFELEPVDDVVGSYCRINTYISQGSDKTASVQMHYGIGLDNLDNLEFTEGSKYTTHVHVLSRDLTYRVTRVNTESSQETGPYVDWDATDFDSHGIPSAEVAAVLAAYGDDVIKAYGRPLIEVTLTLPVEDEGTYRYIDDYIVGDIIDVAGKSGVVTLPEAAYRIIQVTLGQEDATGAVRPKLAVIADRTVSDTLGDSGGE